MPQEQGPDLIAFLDEHLGCGRRVPRGKEVLLEGVRVVLARPSHEEVAGQGLGLDHAEQLLQRSGKEGGRGQGQGFSIAIHR